MWLNKDQGMPINVDHCESMQIHADQATSDLAMITLIGIDLY